MKKITENKKILIIAILIIIVAGIIFLAVKGFNKGIIYDSATRIECYIPSGYEKADIEKITNETFSNKNVTVQDIEKLNQIVSIKIKDYSEEELENFKTKISEKYEIDKDKLEIYEIKIPTTRISTIVKPYVLPVSIVTVLSLVYIALRNIKSKETVKKVIKVALTLVLVAGIYFSILVIAQIPINEYTMPIALMLYVLTLLIEVIKLNKE